jgi:NAD+ kinase
MKVALYGRKIEKSHLKDYNRLYKKLQKMNAEVLIHQELLEESKRFDKLELPDWKSFTDYNDLDNSLDFLISLGGDGTFLNTILLIRDLNIPVVGINTGRLGFLSTTPISESKAALEKLENGIKKCTIPS